MATAKAGKFVWISTGEVFDGYEEQLGNTNYCSRYITKAGHLPENRRSDILPCITYFVGKSDKPSVEVWKVAYYEPEVEVAATSIRERLTQIRIDLALTETELSKLYEHQAKNVQP